MFRKLLIISVAACAVTPAFASPAFADGPTLTIENFVGRINVETAPGQDLQIIDAKRDAGVDISDRSNNLTIDGGIEKHDSKRCKGYYGNISWSLFGKKEKSDQIGGYENLDDLPELTISAPDNAHIIIKNTIPFGTIGDVGSTDVQVKHCGQLTFGNIETMGKFNIHGSGDIEAGNLGSLQANITGSGDMNFGNVAKDASISVRGSGDASFGDAETLDITVSGSGDIEFETVSEALSIDSSGSGDVSGESTYGTLTYESRGSGDFNIDEVNGQADIKVAGSGDVDIDSGDVSYLKIKATGSSHVDFDGTTMDANLRASGASDIYVNKVTGQVTADESGASDIDIGSHD